MPIDKVSDLRVGGRFYERFMARYALTVLKAPSRLEQIRTTLVPYTVLKNGVFLDNDTIEVTVTEETLKKVQDSVAYYLKLPRMWSEENEFTRELSGRALSCNRWEWMQPFHVKFFRHGMGSYDGSDYQPGKSIDLPVADQEVADHIRKYTRDIQLQMVNFVPPTPAEREAASFFKNGSHNSIFGDLCLDTLMAMEFYHVYKNKPFTFEEPYALSGDRLKKFVPNVVNLDTARDNLDYYVGGVLRRFDFDGYCITGSAIAASIINCDLDKLYPNRRDLIDVFYPALYTEITPEIRSAVGSGDAELIPTSNGWAVSRQRLPVTTRPGADLDICVKPCDDVTFDRTAAKIYGVFRDRFGVSTSLTKETLDGDKYKWMVTGPGFRTVEIFRAPWDQIFSYHVGAVRGFYTQATGFVLSASAVLTSQTHQSPNYYYFASKKTSPQEIILKYIRRGFTIAPSFLNRLITNYVQKKGIRISANPVADGCVEPCSLFAYGVEATQRNKIHVNQFFDARPQQPRVHYPSRKERREQLRQRLADRQRQRQSVTAAMSGLTVSVPAFQRDAMACVQRIPRPSSPVRVVPVPVIPRCLPRSPRRSSPCGSPVKFIDSDESETSSPRPSSSKDKLLTYEEWCALSKKS